MALGDIIKKAVNKEQHTSAANIAVLRSWYKERYETVLIQRNLFFLITLAAIIVTLASLLVIRYVRSTKSVEPFVIEIEKKTGVPTVVYPVTIKAYSSDEAVKRYFVWKYITAREEYFPSTYNYMFSTVVRVLSTPEVYYSDYRPKFSIGNTTSPYNLYGQGSTRKVSLKSIIFPTDTSAQVRIAMEVSGFMNMRMDKIVFIEFEFQNVEMNDDERLINPLGFRTTLYRIEDEKGS